MAKVGALPWGHRKVGEPGWSGLCARPCRMGVRRQISLKRFITFCVQAYITEVPLAPFKGNRFNILFHNAVGVCFLLQPLLSTSYLQLTLKILRFCPSTLEPGHWGPYIHDMYLKTWLLLQGKRRCRNTSANGSPRCQYWSWRRLCRIISWQTEFWDTFYLSCTNGHALCSYPGAHNATWRLESYGLPHIHWTKARIYLPSSYFATFHQVLQHCRLE